MNMTERQLRLFVATARLGNVSRASEALHVSQPALTRAIAVFEQQMGAALFSRTTRRLVLTPEGEAFLPTAKRLLQDLEDAGRLFTQHSQGIKGHLRIAVGSSFGSIVLPGSHCPVSGSAPGCACERAGRQQRRHLAPRAYVRCGLGHWLTGR